MIKLFKIFLKKSFKFDFSKFLSSFLNKNSKKLTYV